jgi:hypothetical protein
MNIRISFLKSIITKRKIHVEAKIASFGLTLPSPAVPKGNFSNFIVIGNLAYLSGHLPQVNFRPQYFDAFDIDLNELDFLSFIYINLFHSLPKDH